MRWGGRCLLHRFRRFGGSSDRFLGRRRCGDFNMPSAQRSVMSATGEVTTSPCRRVGAPADGDGVG
ncbi:hypothetical protein FH063_003061 [Azospirillum argentinense]|uniref:Uncharacterized protein n=1 Tax=Azospirillum argentinense TaxID=2970906 RepID=A0A5B0KKH2_9PROT|nr:hypothetical protein FH063_003061 [Azospirillum argentinense]